jgi:hypothetical protein
LTPLLLSEKKFLSKGSFVPFLLASVCRRSLAEFAARTPRKQSNHFFAGSPGEKILLSLQVCPQDARGRLQSPLSEKANGLFRKTA